MKYTETQMMEIMLRLSKFYTESYPADREAIERYLRWCYSQYGYDYTGDSK